MYYFLQAASHDNTYTMVRGWLPWKPLMFSHPAESVEFHSLHKNNTAILYWILTLA